MHASRVGGASSIQRISEERDMPIKTITQPRTNKMFKLGRKRPVARCPRFKLSNYLTRALPPPPATMDYSPKAMQALNQVYLNDQLGDCVIAGMAHVVGVLTGNNGSGAPYVYSKQDIVSLYSAIGGFDPNNPQNTDNGCDEQTALNYWENNGAPAGSHQIAAWISVNGADPVECRTALWLFENLYFGIELPDAWVNPMPDATGFTWDVAGDPDPNNGHCVVGVGYTTKGVTIATWGMEGLITDGAIAKYATTAGSGELYTVLSQDAIDSATKKAPSGFDWTQLIADLDSMGGSISTPATTVTSLARVQARRIAAGKNTPKGKRAAARMRTPTKRSKRGKK
jgi:hypothetical protein